MKSLKILSLVLVLMLILCMGIPTKIYAVISCNPTINLSKTNITQGDEITIQIGVGNISGDYGVIAVGGTLEYNSEVLTITSVKRRTKLES